MKKLFIGIVLTLSSLSATMAIGAEDLGRLFMTPAERSKLDFLRKTTKEPVIVPDQPVEATEEVVAVPVVPPSVSVQGYVKRGDGKKGTVWVNGAPVQEDSNLGSLKVGKMRREGNRVPIELQANGKRLNLKAGQAYDPETNSVLEANAHAEKMAEDEAEDAGTIGEKPVGPLDAQQKSDPNR